MALYTDTVMDHFMHPRNVGEIADADGVGEVGNAKCGDIMKMYLKIKDGKIEDVKFETFGCGSAIASSSIPLPVAEDFVPEIDTDLIKESLDGENELSDEGSGRNNKDKKKKKDGKKDKDKKNKKKNKKKAKDKKKNKKAKKKDKKKVKEDIFNE